MSTSRLQLDPVRRDAALSRNTKPAPAPGAAARTDGGLYDVYKDGYVDIVSDEQLTAAQGQALALRVEAAWKFDLAQNGWSDTSALGKQITVGVLSPAGFEKLMGAGAATTAGVTTGPDTFVVPDTVLTRSNPDDDDTFAHELTHVQDFREGGKRLSQVPIYLQEGKAYVVGDMYPTAEGKVDPALRDVASEVGSITGADAKDVLAHFRTGKDEANAGANGFRDEVTGGLFVEWLRTRFNGGTPDAVQRLAAVTAKVGGGKTFDAAFKEEFGASSKTAEAAFVRYVTQTEGDPRARLSGTIYG